MYAYRLCRHEHTCFSVCKRVLRYVNMNMNIIVLVFTNISQGLWILNILALVYVLRMCLKA